jgi:hypothetical protein
LVIVVLLAKTTIFPSEDMTASVAALVVDPSAVCEASVPTRTTLRFAKIAYRFSWLSTAIALITVPSRKPP